MLSPDDLAFWETNGYVVLHDAVSPANAAAAAAAIYEFLGMDPAIPDTWYRNPQGHSIWVNLIHHPAIWENRRSPRIHSAFAQIWDAPDLWMNADQCGLNPPERPGWTFPGPHLHWDTSLDPPIPFGLQGILYLTDTAADQGAFQCVPGFHRKIDAWLASLPPGADPAPAGSRRAWPHPHRGKGRRPHHLASRPPAWQQSESQYAPPRRAVPYDGAGSLGIPLAMEVSACSASANAPNTPARAPNSGGTT